ncbi:hypothetical protein CONPUDRAFT_134773 [Coniophora puteana RWD-64-598 SS2]|uniref:Uncharacterized protein n=1 Tax=Coniophora puteana (strain RWD-64-598) TaxID=741705 RepID=A0A5M3N0K4_CONPW|nr:uncharacterized protein CONPUDRAFT_134773 [Coniophora puteana RWD-64-598 SS2]EIW84919.1 hypothetical protein CONPUDRAFT_134773 [Coniophora puteana RWD-64-598 SS2]
MWVARTDSVTHQSSGSAEPPPMQRARCYSDATQAISQVMIVNQGTEDTQKDLSKRGKLQRTSYVRRSAGRVTWK